MRSGCTGESLTRMLGHVVTMENGSRTRLCFGHF